MDAGAGGKILSWIYLISRGARAVEQLRLVAIELQMAPIRLAVHIPEPWNLRDGEGVKANAFAPYEQSLSTVLDELYLWGSALKEARAKITKK